MKRRWFLGSTAMTIAAAHLGIHPRLQPPGMGESDAAEAAAGQPHELEAIVRATEWLNSPRLSLANLRGKVVLVDFWTFTCINWLRTLPYVRAWSQRYQDGLIVVGVHTPEFRFEHDIASVGRAVHQMNVPYPVVIDNDYSIWRAFNNQYWPALYFIDAQGRIRDHQFGEGAYERSERVIERLLSEVGVTGFRSGIAPVAAGAFEAAADWTNLRSPETYVLYDRSEGFASRDRAVLDRRHGYTAPGRLALNQWSLTGEWTIGKQATALNKAPGQIAYRFHARDVHLVMGPPGAASPVRFRVTIDGQPPGGAHGQDVDESGRGTASEQRLYQLIRQPQPIVDRTFVIEFLDAGIEAFSFTFG